MRIQLMTAAAVVLLSATGATAQTRPNPSAEDKPPAALAEPFSPALIGKWKSAPEEMKLTSDFDRSVWGANATSVRTVELDVRSNGEASLRVVKNVVDAKRRVIPASTWVEEAQLKIGGAAPGTATRVEHDVSVVSAVRLFPDDKDYRWALDGLRVKLVTFTDGDPNSIEIRYDTPEGRGSFWETLKKDRATAPRRSS